MYFRQITRFLECQHHHQVLLWRWCWTWWKDLIGRKKVSQRQRLINKWLRWAGRTHLYFSFIQLHLWIGSWGWVVGGGWMGKGDYKISAWASVDAENHRALWRVEGSAVDLVPCSSIGCRRQRINRGQWATLLACGRHWQSVHKASLRV